MKFILAARVVNNCVVNYFVVNNCIVNYGLASFVIPGGYLLPEPAQQAQASA